MYLPPEIQTGQKVAFWRSTKEGLYVLYLSEQAKVQVQLGQKAQEDTTGASWWEGYDQRGVTGTNTNAQTPPKGLHLKLTHTSV